MANNFYNSTPEYIMFPSVAYPGVGNTIVNMVPVHNSKIDTMTSFDQTYYNGLLAEADKTKIVPIMPLTNLCELVIKTTNKTIIKPTATVTMEATTQSQTNLSYKTEQPQPMSSNLMPNTTTATIPPRLSVPRSARKKKIK